MKKSIFILLINDETNYVQIPDRHKIVKTDQIAKM